MINLIRKNRIVKWKKQWNILIFVILLMLAASMLWLLTMSFLKEMFTYTSELEWYYKSYYMSKAWLELALVEINNSNVGLSSNVTWWANIIVNNFDCEDCSFEMDIRWKSLFLSDKFWLWTGCTQENAFVLGPWESFLLPLFAQNNTDSINDIVGGRVGVQSLLEHIENLSIEAINTGVEPTNVNVWIFFMSWDELLFDYIYIASGNLNSRLIQDYWSEFVRYYSNEVVRSLQAYQAYLLLSNYSSGSSTIPFCIRVETPSESYGAVNSDYRFPTTKYYVISLWKHKSKYVWLQAIYTQPVPNFMLNTYLNIGNSD